MKTWRACLALVLAVGLGDSLLGQPPIPGTPPVPAVPGAAAVPTAAPAQPTTIWNKLGITKQGCKDCRAKCCQSPLGQLLNSMTMPLGFATGGLIPPLCPPGPTAEELAKLTAPDANASPAEVTAAKIKADEAKAAARRGAIRYLGTVDCHYYPEAEGALISGLRGDRNECVRFEAALALSKGCCCTKKTIAALTIVVNGLDTDGNPSETSERVKSAAMCALQHCLARPGEQRSTPPTPPERPPEPPELPPGIGPRPGVRQAVLTFQTPPVSAPSMDQLVTDAARTMAENVGVSSSAVAPRTGSRNLLSVLAQAVSPPQPSIARLHFDEEALAIPRPHPPRSLAPVAATPLQPPVDGAAR